MFVFLYSTLQVLQKISRLNNKVNNKRYFYGRSIDHEFVLLESIWFTIYMVYILGMDNVVGPIHNFSFRTVKETRFF